MSCISSVTFIPSTLLFDATINGILELTPILIVHSWCKKVQVIFVYWYFILQSFWTLLALIAFCRFYRIFYIWSHVIWKYSFISSFGIWMSFLHLLCFIFQTRTSSTILNRHWDSRCCLIPGIRGKTLNLSPLGMLAKGFS